MLYDHLRDDDLNLAEQTALTPKASDDLLVLGARPRQTQEHQPVADVLESVQAGAHRTRGEENVHPPLEEVIEPVLVRAGIETNTEPHHSFEELAGGSDHAIHVVRIDQRALAERFPRRLQLGRKEHLLQGQHLALRGPQIIQQIVANHRKFDSPHFLLVRRAVAEAVQHQGTVDGQGVVERWLRIEFLELYAPRGFQQLLGFKEVVDHGGGAHRQDAHVRIPLGGVCNEADQGHSPLAGAFVPLLHELHFVEHDKVELARKETAHETAAARHLELLIVQDKIVAPLVVPSKRFRWRAMHDAVRVSPLYLLLPLLDCRVIGDDEGAARIRDARGEDGGQGLPGSDSGPVADPAAFTDRPGGVKLHEVRRLGFAVLGE